MDAARIKYLRAEMEAERLSWDEAAEIEEAFDKLPRGILRDRPENATPADMLEELDAFYPHTHEVSVIFCVTAEDVDTAWWQVYDQLRAQNVLNWTIPDDSVTYVGDDTDC